MGFFDYYLFFFSVIGLLPTRFTAPFVDFYGSRVSFVRSLFFKFPDVNVIYLFNRLLSDAFFSCLFFFFTYFPTASFPAFLGNPFLVTLLIDVLPHKTN